MSEQQRSDHPAEPTGGGAGGAVAGTRPAAILTGMEALALIGFAIWIAVASLGDSDAAQVISEAVTFVVLAVLGGVVARGMARGSGFAKTPGLLWHLVVLLSGMWVAQAGQPLTGGLLAIAGLVGLVLTARLPHADL